jgi:outer membrane protein assembly factor BamD (BamD/ComL family)
LKQDFLKAQTRLQEALQNYPSSVQANFARFYLGRCFWFLAAKESSVLRDKKLPKEDLDVSRKRYKEYLEKARQPFEIVESSLLAQQQKSELSPADASLLRQASFAAAECCFYVGGEYEEAVRRYNLLALRYRHTVEELIALSQLWQCYQIYLRPANPEKASATLDQFRDSLAQIPPALFDRSSPAHARDHWERWLKDVEQLVEKSKAAP